MQNALGVFAAGGLGGLLLLQKQDKQKAEEALSSKLEGERKAVGDLKQQVRSPTNPHVLPIVMMGSICQSIANVA